MPYETPWSVQNPGLVIFLLDQSGAMADHFGPASNAAGERLADQVALVVNAWIRQIGKACIRGPDIRPRVDLAIIGYGARDVVNAGPLSLGGNRVASITELLENPVRVEEKWQKVIDPETFEIADQPVEFPVWVEPAAGGATPMCAALERAASMSCDWVNSHHASHPPVIINITDGVPSDGDPRMPAATLATVETDDGSALLYNCHIAHDPIESRKLRYPVDPVETQGVDPSAFLAPVLFAMSSKIPLLSRRRAEERGFADVRSGSRGFVYNGDVDDIGNIIDIATAPGFVARCSFRTQDFDNN